MAAGSKFRSSREKSLLISLVKSLFFSALKKKRCQYGKFKIYLKNKKKSYLFSPLRGLLCPVPGVSGVAGSPGVCGVHGV